MIKNHESNVYSIESQSSHETQSGPWNGELNQWIKVIRSEHWLVEECFTYYLYSGHSLYLSNSANHSPCVRGGFIPRMRFHVVIDNPDSVNRVMPPSETAPTTMPQQPKSQYPEHKNCKSNYLRSNTYPWYVNEKQFSDKANVKGPPQKQMKGSWMKAVLMVNPRGSFTWQGN